MSESPSPIGATLASKYAIRRLLGRGGMGAVYEGEHVEIGKRVAIKVLDKEHTRTEEVASRFRREGRAASRVESDHVVDVFDVGQDPEFGLYRVMEFLTGEDLATRLEREKLLEVHLAVEFAYQAARGLAKAHAAGVIHRDLKPANIFLSERDDGTRIVKIVDFGISKLLNDENLAGKNGPVTRSGSALGTPQYMSPEQAQGNAIDHRSDVWALGAVLYEMLSGKQAFELLENYEATIFAIVLKKPPPLTEIAPWVPGQLAAIVNKAMEKDVELRIPDCGTFAKLLSEAMPMLHREITGRHSPATERHPDAIVIPAGSTPESAPQSRSYSAQAKTEPTMEAFHSDPSLRAARLASLDDAHRPPTVAGMAVRTGEHGPPSDPRLYPGFEDEGAPPPRRSGLRAVVVLALVGIVGGLGGALYLRGGHLGPFNFGRGSGGTNESAPANAQIDQKAPAAGAAESTPAPVISVASASASVVPRPSASAKTAASGNKIIGTKTAGKPGVDSKASSSAAVASASIDKPAASASSPGQFGGTGVSDNY